MSDWSCDWRCQTCGSRWLAMKVDRSTLIIYCTKCFASVEVGRAPRGLDR